MSHLIFMRFWDLHPEKDGAVYDRRQKEQQQQSAAGHAIDSIFPWRKERALLSPSPLCSGFHSEGGRILIV